MNKNRISPADDWIGGLTDVRKQILTVTPLERVHQCARESSPPGSVCLPTSSVACADGWPQTRAPAEAELRQPSGVKGEGDKSSPEEADERVDEGRLGLSEVAALLFGVTCARDHPRSGLADADSLVFSSCVSPFINRCHDSHPLAAVASVFGSKTEAQGSAFLAPAPADATDTRRDQSTRCVTVRVVTPSRSRAIHQTKGAGAQMWTPTCQGHRNDGWVWYFVYSVYFFCIIIEVCL